MITLYEHQKVMLAYMRLNDSFAIYAEQGCGKTLPTIIRIGELLSQGKANNALVVCPKAVIGSWQRDIAKLDDETRRIVECCTTVVNYDLVWRHDNLLHGTFDIIVIDESHKIKSHSTRRTKALLEMSRRAKYRYELTGTPISNGQLENIWSQFCFLDPEKQGRSMISKIWGCTYYEWINRYAYVNQWHQPYKYKNVDEIQRVIGAHSYRITKSECLDLPEKLPDEIYDIELSEKKMYKQLHKDSTIEDLGVIAENGLARMTKLRQFCSGVIVTDDGVKEIPCEKIEALYDFMESIGDKKLVIFCEFKHSIDRVAEALTNMKVTNMVLDGRQKDKTVWKIFQECISPQVLIVQYQAGCAGIDLYAADTILFYEPTLSSNVLEQARDRIHRIGQKRPCSYVHFITKHSIEVAIYNALSNYKDFNEKMFTEYISDYTKGQSVN